MGAMAKCPNMNIKKPQHLKLAFGHFSFLQFGFGFYVFGLFWFSTFCLSEDHY
jgi:hypothetical protein